ncbi:uncharacterized protein EDB91DRAFT_1121706 [Suillus paluster]|uniref:uncharacterized protein n=1 Tax=Suillus paluster TaxID=48578 RepID=UPI001B85DEBF|nr:uncharacterized protein EDB91DRAFT_1121706 [Suillus paluster]KAG1744939.1 hypothetical protein EDB91DRAFT_1121706 [Suillus paluster]
MLKVRIKPKPPQLPPSRNSIFLSPPTLKKGEIYAATDYVIITGAIPDAAASLDLSVMFTNPLPPSLENEFCDVHGYFAHLNEQHELPQTEVGDQLPEDLLAQFQGDIEYEQGLPLMEQFSGPTTLDEQFMTDIQEVEASAAGVSNNYVRVTTVHAAGMIR